ncbi:MAG: septum formation initiator family protein [Planctomycetes bacterium]|nr:septum formation initiator family protein [Planctomycetota bacterium]
MDARSSETGRTKSRWRGIREVVEVGGFVFWIFACLAISAFFLASGYAGWQKNKKIDAQKVALEQEIERLQARNLALRREGEALTSDPVHVERLLRKHFKMMRDDEWVVESAD